MSTEGKLTSRRAAVGKLLKPLFAALPGCMLAVLLLTEAAVGIDTGGSGNQYAGGDDYIIMVSVNAQEEPGTDHTNYSSVSGDGRFVAFTTASDNLVPGDDNHTADIFVKDTLTGAVIMVSATPDGEPGNKISFRSVISANGRFVVFLTNATNLTPEQDDSYARLLVKDLQTGVISYIAALPDHWQYDGQGLAISADGRFIVFDSRNSNLVPDDSNNAADVFLKDMFTGIITRVSVSQSGQEGNGSSACFRQNISADGRYVTFRSTANNLMGDNNSGELRDQIFVKDTQTGAIALVSTNAHGEPSNNMSYGGSITADGRLVSFTSFADNLMPDKHSTDGSDIYLKNLQTGELELISQSTIGERSNGLSAIETISDDGRYVSFGSSATNLIAGDSNNVSDIFVKDRQTGSLITVSGNRDGQPGNAYSHRPSLSADGRFVAFESEASNLVPGDTNNVSDIFLVNHTIDHLPPVSGDNAPSGWQKGDVTVDFNCRDDSSGCADVSYNLNGATGSGESVTISAEGDNLLTYHATDAAGNVEAEHNVHVAIDKTPPQVTYTGPGGALYQSSPVYVTGTYAETDSFSGLDLAAAQVAINGRPEVPCSAAGGQLKCNVSGLANGRYYATLSFQDQAGNNASATGSFEVRVSKLALPPAQERSLARLRALPLLGGLLGNLLW